MRKILAPHKEQDGWVYVRVRAADPFDSGHIDAKGNATYEHPMRLGARFADGSPAEDSVGMLPLSYYDEARAARTISSRRVERDVETGDYLRLCAEEGLMASWDGAADEWLVFSHDAAEAWKREGKPIVYSKSSSTLREAYHRYHAAADA